MIREDWNDSPTVPDYWSHVETYSRIALSDAKKHTEQLIELVDRLGELTLGIRDELLSFLMSETVAGYSEDDRNSLWKKMKDVVAKHKKFADTNWAMPTDVIARIESVAESIAPKSPSIKYNRLFILHGHRLYDRTTDYTAEREKLKERRKVAIAELFARGD